MAKPTIYLLVEPVNILPIWFSRVLDGLKQNSAKNRYTLHQLSDVTELDGLENLPATVIVLCSQTGWTRHMVQELKARRIMPLLLGVIPEQFGYGVSGIMFARQGLVEKLMDYFVDCGRKKIALTGVNHGSSNDRVKVDAFLKKAQVLGLPLTEDDVYYVDTDIDNSIISCVNNAEKYDGVICSNDYIAAVLMAQAREKGIRIPEDLFVAGVGDTLIGHYTQPTLTTTSSDEFYEMGCQAVNMWRIITDNPYLSNMTITVSTDIIPRGTTAFMEPRTDYYAFPQEEEPPIKIGAQNQVIRSLENCLRGCDEIDMQILHAVLEGKSNEQIEIDLFLTRNSVYYRLKKLYQVANVTNRTELKELFRHYLPNF